jgi:hypothetical protein
MPRAKIVTEIRSLARSHTRTALNVLVGVMRSKDATAAAKVTAANAILDRGWGKAVQAIENGGEGPLELIHRIERIIVQGLDSIADALGDPNLKDQISAAIGDTRTAGRILLGISVVTIMVRLRSLKRGT